jgi:peptidoglycan hydrolase-like protein with peptidoglycan-binding domain
MRRNDEVSGGSFFDDWRLENEAAAARSARVAAARRCTEAEPVYRSLRTRVAAVTTVLAGALVVSVLLPSTSALADPTSRTWYRLRMCESGNNYAINTGNGHFGAYQFDLPTWRSVGGTGYPHRASKAEQDKRALILYRERGWQPWECATILGLREDADAGSGRTGDIRVGAPAPQTRPTSPIAIPDFPGGSHWYIYGEWSRHIKVFQDQMHTRGFFPVGTGEYGPNTLRMVKRLQQLNGLVPNGYIGPNTWRLAWIGKYAAPGRQVQAIPEFPGGSHWYIYGEWSRHIKVFQDQMHARGFFPVGTGEYGPNTLRMVKRLQRLNGLVPNGYIGPNTWRLAWIGKY